MLCILAQTIINLAWHRDKNYVFVQILLAAAQIESEGERWRGGEIDCTLKWLQLLAAQRNAHGR